MQKVVGSSPIIRSSPPLSSLFFFSRASSTFSSAGACTCAGPCTRLVPSARCLFSQHLARLQVAVKNRRPPRIARESSHGGLCAVWGGAAGRRALLSHVRSVSRTFGGAGRGAQARNRAFR